MGYSHISFLSSESASLAVSASPLTIDNRTVTVEFAKGKKKISKEEINSKKKLINENTKTVFVKNLPYSVTEDEVGEFFQSCGKIVNIRFVYNSINGLFKGSSNKFCIH